MNQVQPPVRPRDEDRVQVEAAAAIRQVPTDGDTGVAEQAVQHGPHQLGIQPSEG